ncbi:MAG TPA: FAD-dependent oxidoreductase [Actinotalea sp.]|nr:FAD-dependent oxidoreductase [Actinotalea sp.]
MTVDRPPARPGGPPGTGPGAVTSLVVVGAGLAGAQTVTAARAQGFTGRITLLGAEGTEPYDRPPLSKELLSRTSPAWLRDELGTDLAAADDVRLDDPATGLEVRPDGVVVRTATGTVQADAAVLGTGSFPVLPAGWSALTLHTAADATRLRDRLRPDARLVVVGAGWVGAEVAGVAAAAGVRVTVVEAATAPLSGALGAQVGALTLPWYSAAGVRLLTDARVARVEDHAVTLADGSVLPADVVLVAVGARPASDWLAGALPLLPDGSLAVDAVHGVPGTHGRVAAVGDLARRDSPRHGPVPGGHWDGALRGPATAVAALLAGPRPAGRPPAGGTLPGAAVVDDPAPYVFSTQLGHDLALLGRPGPRDEVVLRGTPGAGGWTALWFADGDTLTAVLAVDRPRDVGPARRLFTGPRLPRLDRRGAADPTVPLRVAALG